MRFKIISLIILIINISSQNPEHNNVYNNQTHLFVILINQYLSKPEMNKAYLSYKQYVDFTKEISKEFPDIINLSSIGNTYLNNPMPIISFKSNSPKKKSGILFTGMHHAREPVAMMMNLYIILHLISLPKSFQDYFFKNINIYFIPIINIDGFQYNSEQYEKTHNLNNCMARKNRNPKNSEKCRSDSIGIDLNRNYDYYFGLDNIGSSPKPCEEDYRGTSAFSEPETKNMKNFMEKHNDIKIVINYHTWGNLVITPFNYLSHNDNVKELETNYSKFNQIYKEFKNEANYPKNFIFGNGDKSIHYTTNGDATDWFFGKMGKLSFSPELGNGNSQSDKFYPNKEVTIDIYQKNLPSALYAIQKSNFFLKAELLFGNFIDCSKNNNKLKKKYDCEKNEVLLKFFVNFINRGFADYNQENGNEMIIHSLYLNNITSICVINSNGKKKCAKNSYFLDFTINENIKNFTNNTFEFEIINDKEEFMKVKNNPKDYFLFNITKNRPFHSGIILNEKFEKFYWLFDFPRINIYNSNFTETTIEYMEEEIDNLKKENKNKKEKEGDLTLIKILFLFILIFCIIILYFRRKFISDSISNVIEKIKGHPVIERDINTVRQIEIVVPQNDSSETSEINTQNKLSNN